MRTVIALFVVVLGAILSIAANENGLGQSPPSGTHSTDRNPQEPVRPRDGDARVSPLAPLAPGGMGVARSSAGTALPSPPSLPGTRTAAVIAGGEPLAVEAWLADFPEEMIDYGEPADADDDSLFATEERDETDLGDPLDADDPLADDLSAPEDTPEDTPHDTLPEIGEPLDTDDPGLVLDVGVTPMDLGPPLEPVDL